MTCPRTWVGQEGGLLTTTQIQTFLLQTMCDAALIPGGGTPEAMICKQHSLLVPVTTCVVGMTSSKEVLPLTAAREPLSTKEKKKKQTPEQQFALKEKK